MSQIWEVELAMSNNEVSQLGFLLLIFMLKDYLFDDSDNCAESVEVDLNDGVSHERVDKLLGGLFAPSALLLEEVGQVRHY